MLYGYTNSATAIGTNALLPFNSIAIQTGCTATLLPGSTSISLNRPGFYMVNFSAVAANSTTASGDVTVEMNINGTAYGGATSSATSASATDTVNLSFSAIVQVPKECCDCNNAPVSLTFSSSGVAATFSNIQATITKLA